MGGEKKTKNFGKKEHEVGKKIIKKAKEFLYSDEYEKIRRKSIKISTLTPNDYKKRITI